MEAPSTRKRASTNAVEGRDSDMDISSEDGPPIDKKPAPLQPRRRSSWESSMPDTLGCIEDYAVRCKIAEGAFAKVYRAYHKASKEVVALKQVAVSREEGFPAGSQREIQILRELKHDNILRLFTVIKGEMWKKDPRIPLSFYLVFEYVPYDLNNLLSDHAYWSGVTDREKADLFLQMMRGLTHCHAHNIIHRDLKPANILLTQKGVLKLADFNLSRECKPREQRAYTNMVISLNYRPLELMLGTRIYGPEVDMWSAGCILYELLEGRMLFSGMREIEVYESIVKVCGTPNPRIWPDLTKMPHYGVISMQAIHSRTLEQLCLHTSNGAFFLLESLLQINPRRRTTAAKALEHFWLRDSHPLRIPLPAPKNPPPQTEMQAPAHAHHTNLPVKKPSPPKQDKTRPEPLPPSKPPAQSRMR